MSKIYNFSAGPAMLHSSFLEAVSKASKDYEGFGLSLMEMSHRSKPVKDMVSETESLARELLNVPDNYHILFLQGGASLQFAMVPINLLDMTMTADYTDTGSWSAKAIKEARLYGNVNIVCSSKDSVYNHIPKQLNQSDDAVYLHITSNNTIYGTQWHEFPKLINDGYLVADMSSDIFSRSIDISQFGLIYAGAQKNIGPAGVTMVIVRDEILDKVSREIPTMMQYRTHIDKGSMFNTPPVISIFAVNRTLFWLKSVGGIDFIEKKNKLKAKKLYDEIDNNELFSSPINVEDRSMMNVPFVLSHKGADESSFLSYCKDRGLETLKGHRSVGGFRASIYNAMPDEGVDALIQAMKEYDPN